tara:strand:- start:866 stop:1120 length:255 start_codon:yes stop_codon:yes gene_type:complete
MTKFLLTMLVTTFLIGAETQKCTSAPVGKYQLETVLYTNKKGTVYIVETVLDTQTGKVVIRRKKKASSYKLPYKSQRGKTITEE